MDALQHVIALVVASLELDSFPFPSSQEIETEIEN